MIDRNSRVVGAGGGPDLSEIQFSQILQENASPAAPDAAAIYQTVLSEGVSPAFFLAFFEHESGFGKKGICFKYSTHSPGNTRSSRIGWTNFITDPIEGRYMAYDTWQRGALDACRHLSDPAYDYARAGATTIAQILPIWAPASDHNDPEVYINSVVAAMNGWLNRNGTGSEVTKPVTTSPQKFFIEWKGTNGNNFWAGRAGYTVQAICDHIMEGTMESSDGWFKDPGSEVSAHFGVAKDGRIWQWVNTTDRAWANGIPENPDTFIPWLGDAVANNVNPNDLTISIEHEGNTGEIFPEAQYQATLWLHRHLISLNPAISADRQHIIGHYQISHRSRPNCPGSGFPWVRLINDLVGGSIPQGGNAVSSNYQPPVPEPDVIFIAATQKSLGFGFKVFWESLNRLGDNFNLLILGYPLTNEFDMVFAAAPGKKRTVQLFERGGLIREPENIAPWDNHPMTSAQVAEATAFATANKLF